MMARFIALRVLQEILRDRRTVAMFLLVPLVVMTLIYYAIREDEQARVGVITRGVARFYEADLVKSLEQEDDIQVVGLDIPDEESDPARLEALIRAQLDHRQADGVLFMEEKLIEDRFAGRRGTLRIYVEGTRPTLTALVLGAISGAMDDLAESLPVVIDQSCSAKCANSVNVKPMDLEKIFLHGSEDYRMVDFFLPVFPPFFVFFFTFILSTITFQRERVRGTLERLMASPVPFGQFVMGYVAGFFLFSAIQSAIILTYILLLISYPINGWQIASMGVVTLFMMLVALAMGLLASFLAHNEFQAIQFVPVVVLPQIFLSDMIWDISTFPPVFQAISWVLPLTHANQAMRQVLLMGHPLWQTWPQLAILSGFFLVTVAALMWVGRSRRHFL